MSKRILQPLGMMHTLTRQPAEADLPADLSKGYKFQNGKFEEQGFEYLPTAPAGCMSSSAGDMARFMIAHLQDGQYESARILSEQSARKMREALFKHDDRLEGMAYGFMRGTYNGETILHHGGDTFWFHSLFMMLPERGVGFFVSYNTDTGGGVPRTELMEAFLDRYYPAAQQEPPQPREGFGDRARATRVNTARRGIRTPRSRSSASCWPRPRSRPTAIRSCSKGAVRSRADRRVAPLVFQEENGQDMLVFHEDDKGRITELFSRNGVAGLVRLPWYETPRFTVILLACVADCYCRRLWVGRWRPSYCAAAPAAAPAPRCRSWWPCWAG